jgi:hypothetical protein
MCGAKRPASPPSSPAIVVIDASPVKNKR